MMPIYPIVRIQLSFVQFSLICYDFFILSKAECKNIYYHFKRDHESSSFPTLARNKCICRETFFVTNKQVANPCNTFANNLSNDIKLSKTQLSKMIQSGGFLGRRLGPVLKTGLSLMKNVIKLLAKSILNPLELTAAASAEKKIS